MLVPAMQDRSYLAGPQYHFDFAPLTVLYCLMRPSEALAAHRANCGGLSAATASQTLASLVPYWQAPTQTRATSIY